MNNLLRDISREKAILIYILVSLFLFFEMAVQVSPSVMAPQLMREMSIGTFGLGLMSGFYFYTYTAMQIPSGILLDQQNPRIIITLAILVCALGTLLFAFAHNIVMGSLARLLMGLGSAFAFVSVLVVTADLFEHKYFATMTGITQMLAALGAMAGQMPISLLIAALGWRKTMVCLFVTGIVLAILVWLLIRYKRQTTATAIHQQNKKGLRDILRNRQTWFIALYACLLWAPMSGFTSLWGVPFLVNENHLGQHTAAFLCSLMWLGLAICSPLLGIWSEVMGKRVMPLWLTALIGALMFFFILEWHVSVILLSVFLLIAGAACAGQALSFTVVKENNNETNRGTAIAVNNMAVVISGAIFQPLMGKLIEYFNLHHNPSAYKYGCFVILAAYLIGGFLAILFIKEPKASRI